MVQILNPRWQAKIQSIKLFECPFVKPVGDWFILPITFSTNQPCRIKKSIQTSVHFEGVCVCVRVIR